MTAEEDDYGVYRGNEIHFHISGAISASLVPWWIHWFRHINTAVIVNVSISRSARRFVSIEALTHLSNGKVWEDDWETAETQHWRDGGTGSSDCIVVFPATLDTTMRLAQGRSDSPALMMLQLTSLPVILCESIPAANSVIDHWRNLLLERSNFYTAPYVSGVKTSDRQQQDSGFNLPGAITLANELIRDRNA